MIEEEEERKEEEDSKDYHSPDNYAPIPISLNLGSNVLPGNLEGSIMSIGKKRGRTETMD